MRRWWRIRLAGTILAAAALAVALDGADRSATAGAGPPGLETRRVPVEGGGAYTDVNAAGLATMLRTKAFPLVNVHIPYEGEIEKTDLFIPFDQIEAHLDKLPADKGAQVVLYCRSGGMSAVAARDLVKRGYTNVLNLDGGMIAWTQAGYPLVHGR